MEQEDEFCKTTRRKRQEYAPIFSHHVRRQPHHRYN